MSNYTGFDSGVVDGLNRAYHEVIWYPYQALFSLLRERGFAVDLTYSALRLQVSQRGSKEIIQELVFDEYECKDNSYPTSFLSEKVINVHGDGLWSGQETGYQAALALWKGRESKVKTWLENLIETL